MLCFAANSLLCRLALAPKLIDPATFTSVRVLSAAAMLSIVVWLRRRHLPRLSHANPRSIAALFAYLIFFSFAYTRLSAGTGALILIGGVQLTMFCIALHEGERFSLASWVGTWVGSSRRSLSRPAGRQRARPIGSRTDGHVRDCMGILFTPCPRRGPSVESNADNLLWCLLPAALVNLCYFGDFNGTSAGFGLAIASGAVATGFGYIVWYLALRDLSAAHAATVQLSMPAIAALGGVAFLAEPLSLRLLIASAAMLGEIAIVLTRRSHAVP